MLIAGLFFPGTVLHEFAHAFTAIVLLLRVRAIELFPQWHGGKLRLGSVLYEKKDPVRSFIVGITPFIFGMFFFWILAAFNLFPYPQIDWSIFLGYLIFSVSSTMFSSQQDLKDILIALPIILFTIGILYVISGFGWVMIILPKLEWFIHYITMYLFFCLLIHIILLVVLFIAKRIFKL